MKYKIGFNKAGCYGCGACTQCNNWVMGDDGKAYPLQTELEVIGCNQKAAEICPAGIIQVIANN